MKTLYEQAGLVSHQLIYLASYSVPHNTPIIPLVSSPISSRLPHRALSIAAFPFPVYVHSFHYSSHRLNLALEVEASCFGWLLVRYFNFMLSICCHAECIYCAILNPPVSPRPGLGSTDISNMKTKVS